MISPALSFRPENNNTPFRTVPSVRKMTLPFDPAKSTGLIVIQTGSVKLGGGSYPARPLFQFIQKLLSVIAKAPVILSSSHPDEGEIFINGKNGDPQTEMFEAA
jgi:hypothetical protein